MEIRELVMTMEDVKDRPKVGVCCLIMKDNKVLFGKRKGKRSNGTWCPPGGHVELGEDPKEAAIREVLEETGLKLSWAKFITYTNDVYPDSGHYVTMCFISKYETGEVTVTEPEAFYEWGWYEWDNLPQPLMLGIQNLLKQNFNPFKYMIDRIALMHVKDGKLLAARAKNKDKFYLPGGKRDAGETDVQALTREIKEELNVDIIPNSMKLMGIFEGQAHGKPNGTIVHMTYYLGDIKGELKPDPTEIAEVRYLSYEEKSKFPIERAFLFDLLKEKGLI